MALVDAHFMQGKLFDIFVVNTFLYYLDTKWLILSTATIKHWTAKYSRGTEG